MIDRAALIIRPKQPFLDWLSHAVPELNDDVTLEVLHQDLPVQLISLADADVFDDWLQDHFVDILEHEFGQYVENRGLWPEQRDWVLFNRWFDIHLHTQVFDVVD